MTFRVAFRFDIEESVTVEQAVEFIRFRLGHIQSIRRENPLAPFDLCASEVYIHQEKGESHDGGHVYP